MLFDVKHRLHNPTLSLQEVIFTDPRTPTKLAYKFQSGHKQENDETIILSGFIQEGDEPSFLERRTAFAIEFSLSAKKRSINSITAILCGKQDVGDMKSLLDSLSLQNPTKTEVRTTAEERKTKFSFPSNDFSDITVKRTKSMEDENPTNYFIKLNRSYTSRERFAKLMLDSYPFGDGFWNV